MSRLQTWKLRIKRFKKLIKLLRQKATLLCLNGNDQLRGSFHGSFFREALPIINKIFYSMIKEKDQMPRSHIRVIVFCNKGGYHVLNMCNFIYFDYKRF